MYLSLLQLKACIIVGKDARKTFCNMTHLENITHNTSSYPQHPLSSLLAATGAFAMTTAYSTSYCVV